MVTDQGLQGMKRRLFLTLFAGALVVGAAGAEAGHRESRLRQLRDLFEGPVRRRRRRAKPVQIAARLKKKKSGGGYRGKTIVAFRTGERRGTIIIRTSERALYYVLGAGQAIRYGVAVGKEGFQWSGTARIGAKAVNPPWTPPAEMIERKPELEEWAGGMPGGISENPLGVRAMYLYRGRRDTQFRIHGTNAPWSIGTAASSGCIRMLNSEVVDLYRRARIGAKVIVQ